MSRNVKYNKNGNLEFSKYHLSEIYKIAEKARIRVSDVDEAIDVLGYKNTLTYTSFFANSSIPRENYINGIQAIAKGDLDIEDIEELSELENSVRDIITKFNFNSGQLTKDRYRDDIEDSSHHYEHFGSRLDRL